MSDQKPSVGRIVHYVSYGTPTPAERGPRIGRLTCDPKSGIVVVQHRSTAGTRPVAIMNTSTYGRRTCV
jgi:hypothetical protein